MCYLIYYKYKCGKDKYPINTLSFEFFFVSTFLIMAVYFVPYPNGQNFIRNGLFAFQCRYCIIYVTKIQKKYFCWGYIKKIFIYKDDTFLIT